ncbi:MAG: trimeric intracellular cation channel family protein [Clostridia bacterium]|nr:trimeric intracellular cation channel family protein [Clostridia bacterium]
MTEFMNFLELVGTIAFSVSGALVAIGANLDIFGVVFVSCITAVGGGMTRDILLGLYPPAIFLNSRICVIAMAVSVVVFVIAYRNRRHFGDFRMRIEQINNVFDALGLAAFTVTGAEVAYINGYGDNGFLVVAVGMITAVGGGIYRDVITNTTPYVFKKHIYALATILGGIVYYYSRKYFFADVWTFVLPMMLVVLVRLLATKYRWSLPKIHLEE